MRVEDLLDRRLVIIRVDVPDLKLAVKCADQKVVLVDLIQVCRVLVIVNLVLDGLGPRFDIDVADENLLVFEA